MRKTVGQKRATTWTCKRFLGRQFSIFNKSEDVEIVWLNRLIVMSRLQAIYKAVLRRTITRIVCVLVSAYASK